MQIPLELAFHEIDPSEFVESHIRDRVERLETFHDRITSCRVIVEAPHRDKRRVKQFRVRINTRVPGAELVAESKPTEDDDDGQNDLYFAIDDAFDSLERQLKKLGEKLRANRQQRPQATKGVIASLNHEDNRGMIEAMDGRELSFTNEDVHNAELASLSEGDTVEFQASASSSPYPRVDYVRA